MLLHFGIFFSVSVLLAVSTRSTVACVFGSVVFWVICWGMNYGRNVLVTLPGIGDMPGAIHYLVEAGYWLLPKPADLGMLLFDTMGAGEYFGRALDVDALRRSGAFLPELSVLSSVLFGVVILGLAGYEFVTADY
jgi:hypothetical protein